MYRYYQTHMQSGRIKKLVCVRPVCRESIRGPLAHPCDFCALRREWVVCLIVLLTNN